MIVEYEASPFYVNSLEPFSFPFLENRGREIFTVQAILDAYNFPDIENLVIADYEMANDVEFIFKRDKVVVLDFHILTLKELTERFIGEKIYNIYLQAI